ncbi:inositol monophosphatase family protein [Chloroflexus aggregans]|uniref:inositol-phosphate phosphatase n=1 Tax=Chloroflexus aggregans (strain MD-66 / DSM 9485) TaxID=326427 RepID=B8G496_CHLAD|nr:inositol monophosphatase family protein [Chloroflexus aggregans]ACL23502.1 Inositol-phosphate phosphatase [Chloroflexus aggregans DSM 9485]
MEIDVALVRVWAQRAGELLLHSYFNRVIPERKLDTSVVTMADRAIEDWLREQILAHYPHHGVIGEERGPIGLEREYVWVIDPIDGTSSFVAGLPMWAVSIGVLWRGEPLIGVIYLPVLRDCYWAIAGEAAFWNDTPIHVAPPEPPSPNDWIAIPSTFHRAYTIHYPGKVRVLGSVAADCCYVARGKAQAAIIGRAKVWDVAAGWVIVQAAGGVVCPLEGTLPDWSTLLHTVRLPTPVVIGHAEQVQRVCAWVRRISV